MVIRLIHVSSNVSVGPIHCKHSYKMNIAQVIQQKHYEMEHKHGNTNMETKQVKHKSSLHIGSAIYSLLHNYRTHSTVKNNHKLNTPK